MVMAQWKPFARSPVVSFCTKALNQPSLSLSVFLSFDPSFPLTEILPHQISSLMLTHPFNDRSENCAESRASCTSLCNNGNEVWCWCPWCSGCGPPRLLRLSVILRIWKSRQNTFSHALDSVDSWDGIHQYFFNYSIFFLSFSKLLLNCF
jgi:hypothetical protein